MEKWAPQANIFRLILLYNGDFYRKIGAAGEKKYVLGYQIRRRRRFFFNLRKIFTQKGNLRKLPRSEKQFAESRNSI